MIVNTPFIYDRNCIRIYEEITNNAITIDGIDYFVDSISPGYKNSKGANSYVFALYQMKYLQLIIPQYFISNKSGIWSLSLIVHSKG